MALELPRASWARAKRDWLRVVRGQFWPRVGAVLAAALAGWFLGGFSWLGFGIGVVTLLVLACLVAIFQLLAAPERIHAEQQEEIQKLRKRLDPEVRVDVEGGPIPVKSSNQRFLVFSLTLRNGADAPISAMLYFRAEIVTGFMGSVRPEGSPLRVWEEQQTGSRGGPLPHLRVPLDLGANESARGYVGFSLPKVFQAVASVRRELKACLEFEELGSRRRTVVWRSQLSLVGLGLKPEAVNPTPPEDLPSSAASE